MVIKINVLGLYLLIFRDKDSILLYKKVHMYYDLIIKLRTILEDYISVVSSGYARMLRSDIVFIFLHFCMLFVLFFSNNKYGLHFLFRDHKKAISDWGLLRRLPSLASLLLPLPLPLWRPVFTNQ